MNVVSSTTGAPIATADVGCLFTQNYTDTFDCCGTTTTVAGTMYSTERLGPTAVLPVAAVSLPAPLGGVLGAAAMVLGTAINISVWWATPGTEATATAWCGQGGSGGPSGKTGGVPSVNCDKNLIYFPWGGTQRIASVPTAQPGRFLGAKSQGAEVGGLLAYRSGVDELSKFPALIEGFNARDFDVPRWFPRGTIQLDTQFDDGGVVPVWLSMKDGRITRFKTTPFGAVTTYIRADEETVTRFLTSEFPVDYFIKSIISGRLLMSRVSPRPALDAVPTVFDGQDPVDSLTRVEGIDAVLTGKLAAAGIFQLSDLRDVDTGAVKVEGITRDRLARFKQAAGILFEFPQLTGDDAEVLMEGLGESSAERLRMRNVTFEAKAIQEAVAQTRVPKDYDPSTLMALFAPG